MEREGRTRYEMAKLNGRTDEPGTVTVNVIVEEITRAGKVPFMRIPIDHWRTIKQDFFRLSPVDVPRFLNELTILLGKFPPDSMLQTKGVLDSDEGSSSSRKL
jgi:hypothetical protein